MTFGLLARRHRSLLWFFALAFVFSWTAWAPLAANGLGWTTPSFSPYLHLVGGLGPLLAALVVTAACEGRPGLGRLVERCVVVRGRLSWIAFAIAAPILLLAISILALRVGGRTDTIRWADVGRSVEFPELAPVAYWAANVLFYGFGEELGWRGFALPRLQARFSALTSAIVVGGAWAAWHLPLFAFAGGLSVMGPAEVAGWLFSILTGSVLMTWLFNSSRGSVLAVALFHGVLDIVMTSPAQAPLMSIVGATLTICGLAAPLVFGATNLSRRRRTTEAVPDDLVIAAVHPSNTGTPSRQGTHKQSAII